MAEREEPREDEAREAEEGDEEQEEAPAGEDSRRLREETERARQQLRIESDRVGGDRGDG